jgi:hypothetical protein
VRKAGLRCLPIVNLGWENITALNLLSSGCGERSDVGNVGSDILRVIPAIQKKSISCKYMVRDFEFHKVTSRMSHKRGASYRTFVSEPCRPHKPGVQV